MLTRLMVFPLKKVKCKYYVGISLPDKSTVLLKYILTHRHIICVGYAYQSYIICVAYYINILVKFMNNY